MTLWYLNNFWPLETRFTNPATKWVRRLWCSPLIDQMVSQWCRSEATTNREEKISVLPEFFPPPPEHYFRVVFVPAGTYRVESGCLTLN